MEQILYDENNNRLFFTIWRNKYLKNLILTDCLFFKNHRKSKEFGNVGKFNKHRFWYYFQDIKLKKINDTIIYPPFLESITFGEIVESISKEIIKRMLVVNKNLLKLKFGNYFNSNELLYILSYVPNSVTSIQFGRHFNQPLPFELSLNSSLKKLTFCEMFNQPIDNLPLGLTHLKIHNHSGYFCYSNNFYQPVNISFLKSLVYLGLTGAFNNPIPIGSLNNGGVLKTIKFGKRFNHQLPKGVIPDGVESVYITNEKYYLINQESIHLPNSVKFLKIAFYSDKLLSIIPIKLHTLAFTKYFKDEKFHLKTLPQNIKRLELRYFESKIPELLPLSLKEIVLPKNHLMISLLSGGKYKIIDPQSNQLY